MIIRAAQGGDGDAICAIVNGVIRDTLNTFTTVEKTAAQMSVEIAQKSGQYLVAEEGGHVVGHAYFGTFRAGPGYRHTAELTIHLLPIAQGRGIGRGLMRDLEHLAMKAGIHVLVAAISGANPKAVAFHAALGFVEVGRLPEVGHKRGRWLDMVLMQKILPPSGQARPDSRGKAR